MSKKGGCTAEAINRTMMASGREEKLEPETHLAELQELAEVAGPATDDRGMFPVRMNSG